MNDATTYSQDGMNSGIDALRNAHRTFTDLLEELKGQLNTSLAQWEDGARVAYQEEQTRWDQAAAKQQSIVERLPVLLRQISDGYNETERTNTGLWRG